SVAFRDSWHGIVGGGDLTTDSATQAATSDDGGRSWRLTSKPPIPGAIFCLARFPKRLRTSAALFSSRVLTFSTKQEAQTKSAALTTTQVFQHFTPLASQSR